jgi:23S rRNA pseudouridine1911/1915/1917 synthase
VHRLDKGTSGLLVVARNDAAHRALAAQLADRTLSRTYLAVVKGVVEHDGGVLEGDIARDRSHRQRMAVVESGRFARTRYAVLQRLQAHTLIRCDLETGRTHQIRVHVAALGHPIAGDEQYGRRRAGDPERPMLHAWRLRLTHPSSSREMNFEAQPPADFVDYVRQFGGELA